MNISKKANDAGSISNKIKELKNTMSIEERKLSEIITKLNDENGELSTQELEIINKSKKPEYNEEIELNKKDLEENTTKLNKLVLELKELIGSNKEDPDEIIKEARKLREDVLNGTREDFVQAQLLLKKGGPPGKPSGPGPGAILEAIKKGELKAQLKHVEKIKEIHGSEDVLGKVKE